MNLRARNAVRQFRETRGDPADAIATVQASLRKLESLTEAVGPTPERLSLQGGCWKRIAQLESSRPAADEALKRMKQCCDEATGLGGKDPDYPRFMACSAAICMAVRDGSPCDPAVGKDLQRMVDEPAPDEADFWKLIRSADARTNVAILDSASPDGSEKIRDAYRRAWRHIGSPVKMRSVTEQLEFYEDIFGDGAPETAASRKHVVEWIAEIRHFIETELLAK